MTTFHCGIEAKVANSRHRDGTRIRRRACKVCGHRWNTMEMPAADVVDTVLATAAARATLGNAIGRAREAFQRETDQLDRRVFDALEHRRTHGRGDTGTADKGMGQC